MQNLSASTRRWTISTLPSMHPPKNWSWFRTAGYEVSLVRSKYFRAPFSSSVNSSFQCEKILYAIWYHTWPKKSGWSVKSRSPVIVPVFPAPLKRYGVHRSYLSNLPARISLFTGLFWHEFSEKLSCAQLSGREQCHRNVRTDAKERLGRGWRHESLWMLPGRGLLHGPKVPWEGLQVGY